MYAQVQSELELAHLEGRGLVPGSLLCDGERQRELRTSTLPQECLCPSSALSPAVGVAREEQDGGPA